MREFLDIKTLDKYIIKQLLTAIGVVVFVLLGIAWLSQIIRLIELFFSHNLPFLSFLRFSSYLLPGLVAIVLPIAFLIAVLFIYNKLISDRELIVMKAVGMDLKALYKPIFVVSVLLFILNFLLNHFIAPYSAVAFKKYKTDFIGDLSQVVLKEKTFNDLASGLTVYVDNTKGNILYDIFINDSREKSSKTIYAEKGQVLKTEKGFSVVLVNGSLHESKSGETRSEDRITFGKFENYTIDLGLAKEKSMKIFKPKELSTYKLLTAEKWDFVRKDKINKYKVEGHKRFVMPFYNIIFGMICAMFILSARFSRQGNFKPVFTSVISCLFVYSVYIGAFSFVRKSYEFIYIPYVLTLVLIVFLRWRFNRENSR
ncbi:MAG: LPS export ABC transporter permease LptF [Alphaproteobacteria bacterium]|jgi:lipopolysaccharide export system permease protein|nr:LPS export ABC transporter permease LptF [Alphaproteobacteria bacterium]